MERLTRLGKQKMLRPKREAATAKNKAKTITKKSGVKRIISKPSKVITHIKNQPDVDMILDRMSKNIHTQTEDVVFAHVHVQTEVVCAVQTTQTEVISSDAEIQTEVGESTSIHTQTEREEKILIDNQTQAETEVISVQTQTEVEKTLLVPSLYDNEVMTLAEASSRLTSNIFYQPATHFFFLSSHVKIAPVFSQSQDVRENIAKKNGLNSWNWTKHLFDNFMTSQPELAGGFLFSRKDKQIVDAVSFFAPNLIKLVITPALANYAMMGQNNKYRVTGKLQPWLDEGGRSIIRCFDLAFIENGLKKSHVKFPAISLLPMKRDGDDKELSAIMKGCDYGGVILFFEDGVFELIGFTQFYLIKECVYTIISLSILADSYARKISQKIYVNAIALLRRELTLDEYYASILC
jgi:hypothetical protein